MSPRISGMGWAVLAGVLSACATLGRPKETEKGRDFVAEFIPRPEWARRRDDLLQGNTTFWQGQPDTYCKEGKKLQDSLIVDSDDPSVRRSGREETISNACYYSYTLDQYTVENAQRAHFRRFSGGSVALVLGQTETAVVYSHKKDTKYQREGCSEDGSCQEERWVPQDTKTDRFFHVYGTARLDVLDGEPIYFQSIDDSMNVFLEGVPTQIKISWGNDPEDRRDRSEMDCKRESGKWRCNTAYDTRYKGREEAILRGGLNAHYASVALAGLLD